MQKAQSILLFLFIVLTKTMSQQAPTPAITTFEVMKKGYTGNVEYDPTTKTVTFTSSGTMFFDARLEKTDNIWHIPTTILKVLINENVTVTGQFTWGHAMNFEGKNKHTSIVYGTSEKGVLRSEDLDRKYSCVAYSTFYGYGAGDNYIKNLSCFNPLGFMFTGKSNCRIHLEGVRGIDDRGGFSNHSDGISAASGSTVKNCYLETGDDAIKVYADIYVENTDIVMVQNCVPIQYGWGTYGSGATGTFKNVRITGNSGRNAEKFVINMASDSAGVGYNKTIIMDSCIIENPIGTLFLMKDNTVKSNVTITNSRIKVKDFGVKSGTGVISICGSSKQNSEYNCLVSTKIPDLKASTKVWPNPFTNILNFETEQSNISFYACDGRKILVESEFCGNNHSINTSNLSRGFYIVTDFISSSKIKK